MFYSLGDFGKKRPAPPIHYGVVATDSFCLQKTNLRSGVPIFFRGGKVRLIQLHVLYYLSVASPESGLFSDWSRDKRYSELSH